MRWVKGENRSLSNRARLDFFFADRVISTFQTSNNAPQTALQVSKCPHIAGNSTSAAVRTAYFPFDGPQAWRPSLVNPTWAPPAGIRAPARQAACPRAARGAPKRAARTTPPRTPPSRARAAEALRWRAIARGPAPAPKSVSNRGCPLGTKQEARATLQVVAEAARIAHQ